MAFIVFDIDIGSAGGNTSCNVFGGNYEANGGKFRHFQAISTMRACIEDNRMSVERGMFDGLRKADRYAIFENRLALYNGGQELLTFIGTEKNGH